jgi:hypothetical protein
LRSSRRAISNSLPGEYSGSRMSAFRRSRSDIVLRAAARWGRCFVIGLSK